MNLEVHGVHCMDRMRHRLGAQHLRNALRITRTLHETARHLVGLDKNLRAHAATRSTGWKHRWRWLLPALNTGGFCVLHVSVACVHRGEKAQPAGSASAEGATPGTCISGWPRATFSGTEPSKPIVYGCWGCSRIVSTSPVSTTRPASI